MDLTLAWELEELRWPEDDVAFNAKLFAEVPLKTRPVSPKAPIKGHHQAQDPAGAPDGHQTPHGGPVQPPNWIQHPPQAHQNGAAGVYYVGYQPDSRPPPHDHHIPLGGPVGQPHYPLQFAPPQGYAGPQQGGFWPHAPHGPAMHPHHPHSPNGLPNGHYIPQGGPVQQPPHPQQFATPQGYAGPQHDSFQPHVQYGPPVGHAHHAQHVAKAQGYAGQPQGPFQPHGQHVPHGGPVQHPLQPRHPIGPAMGHYNGQPQRGQQLPFVLAQGVRPVGDPLQRMYREGPI